MFRVLNYGLGPAALFFLALVVVLTVHEFSHALVAHFLGDPTARRAGRLSLNPLRHLDPLGSLMVFLVGLGWAKPVPVSTGYFRNPRRDMAVVGLAGPASNFLFAWAVASAYKILGGGGIIWTVLGEAAAISIALGVFNLIPLPPLDGSRVLAAVLPGSLLVKYESVERYGILILFLAISVFRTQFNALFFPIVNVVGRALS